MYSDISLAKSIISNGTKKVTRRRSTSEFFPLKQILTEKMYVVAIVAVFVLVGACIRARRHYSRCKKLKGVVGSTSKRDKRSCRERLPFLVPFNSRDFCLRRFTSISRFERYTMDLQEHHSLSFCDL